MLGITNSLNSSVGLNLRTLGTPNNRASYEINRVSDYERNRADFAGLCLQFSNRSNPKLQLEGTFFNIQGQKIE